MEYYWIISLLTFVLYLLLLLFFSFRKEDVIALLKPVKPSHDPIPTSTHITDDEQLILDSQLAPYHIPQYSKEGLVKTIKSYRFDKISRPFLGWYYAPPIRIRNGSLPPLPTYDQFMDPTCPPDLFQPLDEPLAKFLNAKQFMDLQATYIKQVLDGAELIRDFHSTAKNSLQYFLQMTHLTIGTYKLWFLKQPVMYMDDRLQTPLPNYEEWLSMSDREQETFFYGKPYAVTTYLNNKVLVLNNPHFVRILNDTELVTPQLYDNPTELFIARLKRSNIPILDFIPESLDVVSSDDDDDEED